MYKILVILFFTIFLNPAWGGEDPFNTSVWPRLSDKHFVVIFKSSADESMARDILRRAEENYSKIDDSIGYSRYQLFWTWDERVKIILFPDQRSYIAATGQPAWSEGMAQPYTHLFRTRLIATFKGQSNVFAEVLPHEIGHLILHDFMGFDKSIPLFFDEGFAQLAQEREDLNYLGILAHLATQGRLPSVAVLLDPSSLSQQDPQAVSIFYAESLYIVDFLIKNYGRDQFKELCRHLRDGKGFEEAIKAAYYPTINSIEDLQIKWTRYLLAHL